MGILVYNTIQWRIVNIVIVMYLRLFCLHVSQLETSWLSQWKCWYEAIRTQLPRRFTKWCVISVTVIKAFSLLVWLIIDSYRIHKKRILSNCYYTWHMWNKQPMGLHNGKPQRKMSDSDNDNDRSTDRCCGCFARAEDCLYSLREESRYEDIVMDAYQSLQKDAVVCESCPAVFHQVGLVFNSFVLAQKEIRSVLSSKRRFMLARE